MVLYQFLNHWIDRMAANGRLLALIVFLPALLLRLLAAWFNLGYFAVDDYTVLANSIPVQLISSLHSGEGGLNLRQLVAVEEIRSPLPQAMVYGVAWLAYQLGGVDPIDQVRAVFLTMAFISLLSIYCGWRILANMGRLHQAVIAALLLAFHYFQPFISTRSMIENMAAPFVMLSLLYAQNYWNRGDRRALAISVVWLALAAMLRFQAGVLALCYPALIFLRSDWRAIWALAIGGLAGLILTGVPDLLISGQFHGTIVKYIDYNLKYASKHGVSPFFAYIPVLVAIFLPPAFISRYRGFGWIEQYRPLLPAVLFAVVFFAAHSAVPHKEDRFLIPVLPVFLMLMAPMAQFLLRAGGRLILLLWFSAANLILLAMLIFFTFQSNIIDLVRYLNDPRIERLTVFEDTLTYYPYIYGQRGGLAGFRIVARYMPPPELSADCNEVMVVRADFADEAKVQLAGLSEVARFKASPLEHLTVLLNPTGGGRRSPMLVFAPPACAERLAPQR